MRAVLKRSGYVAAVSLIVSLVALALSREFLLMHMVLLAAVSMSGGITCARAAIPIHPPSVRRAGNIGGMVAAIVFILPFLTLFSYLAVVIDAPMAARLAAGLSTAEATELVRQNIAVGVDYFRGQFISYASGYLLFGLFFGFLLGSAGAAIARRGMARAGAPGRR